MMTHRQSVVYVSLAGTKRHEHSREYAMHEGMLTVLKVRNVLFVIIACALGDQRERLTIDGRG